MSNEKKKREIGGIPAFSSFGGGDEPSNTDVSVYQQTSKAVSQHTDKQVSQHTDKQPLHRATFYISDEDDEKLERLVLTRNRNRRRTGAKKVDKSALIREAIALLKEE